MHLYPEHERWRALLGHHLLDVEHFIDHGESPPVHYAVAVLQNGECFVGTARCGKRDQYSHKVGYRIAVGRAFKHAVNKDVDLGFVDPELTGRDLYLAVREQLFNSKPEKGRAR